MKISDYGFEFHRGSPQIPNWQHIGPDNVPYRGQYIILFIDALVRRHICASIVFNKLIDRGTEQNFLNMFPKPGVQ